MRKAAFVLLDAALISPERDRNGGDGTLCAVFGRSASRGGREAVRGVPAHLGVKGPEG
jgi:hypothetical protein